MPATHSSAGTATNKVLIGSSVKTVKAPAAHFRLLTEGEIAMASTIFKTSIDYSQVKVHNHEYLWFGLQPDDTAMTPNGEMFFNEKHFLDDFSTADFGTRLWFMHEMVHVWQYQLGYPVKRRGMIRIGLSYKYSLGIGKTLSDYNMEAQGNLLSDYWAVSQFGTPEAMAQAEYVNAIALYEIVLATFISNPSDTASLPGHRHEP